MNQNNHQEYINILHKIYPQYSDKQIEEVDRTIYRHVALLVRMTERIATTETLKKTVDEKL